MPPVEFEHIISAGRRPQTYALDRAVTGTGKIARSVDKILRTVEIKIPTQELVRRKGQSGSYMNLYNYM